MRSKEEAHDYRYFPEPDLPPLRVAPARVAGLLARLPELPDPRRRRLTETYALSEYDAALLASTAATSRFFEEVVAACGRPKAAANWMTGELARKLKETGGTMASSAIRPADLAGLIDLVEAGTISGSLAKDVFEKMWGTDRSAADIVRAEGLARIDDEAALGAIVREVVAANPKPVAQFRAGKAIVFGFFVGQVMKATRGQADPTLVNEIVRRELERA